MVYASRFLRYENILMRGPDVTVLQKKLNSKGYNAGAVDGIFGEKTQLAVKTFQQSHSLPVDGIVGPETWSRLYSSPLLLPRINFGYKESHTPSITIDIDNRILYFISQTSSRTYSIAVGKRKTPTPLGNWGIVQKVLNPEGPFGTRWMKLSIPWGGYGIHGTNNPSSIGTAASHGCIRLYNTDVIELYDITPIGTPVYIIGKAFTGRLLKIGCKGKDVEDIQEDLAILSLYTSAIDGYFGRKTQQAVINFQKSEQIIPDGIVGPATYNALQKSCDIAGRDHLP